VTFDSSERSERLEAEPPPASVVRLADVEAEGIRWLWPGRVPLAKLTVVDGDPGLGKSTLLLDLAARVSTGSPLPDGSPLEAAGGVLLLSAEDGLADTIRPRLEVHGADLSRIYALESVPDDQGGRPPAIPVDLPLVEQEAAERDVVLIVIDPLLAFLAGNVDSHRDQDVRRALHALTVVAERTGAAIVVVRHLNKASGPRAIYRGGGSIGIIGAARSGLLVAEDPQDPDRRVLASIKSNLAKRPDALAFRLVADQSRDVARVSWEGVLDIDADTLLGPRLGDGKRRPAHAEAEDFLRDTLADGPRQARDVEADAESVGIARKTLERARKQIGVKPHKEGFGSAGRWFWSLPVGDALSDHTHKPAVLSGNGLSKTKRPADRASGDPKSVNTTGGALSTAVPGDRDFRAFLNGAYAAGHVTDRERHEGRMLHDLILRAGPPAGELAIQRELDELLAEGVLLECEPKR